MFRLRAIVGLASCLFFLAAVIHAQLSSGNVHVYVTFPDDRATTEQLKVGLFGGSSGNQIAETYTNDHGQAQFLGVGLGNYRVVVSGQGIQTTESEEFEVDARQASQSIFVRVRSSAPAQTDPLAGKPTISASDLKIPKKASKEFDKGTQFIAHQQWDKALEHLNKALEIYPKYAEAYTNLGVVYARMGDTEKERDALMKAIDANDHFAPAYVNLAQMEMRLHDFNAAEDNLKKAIAVDPNSVHTEVLLAQAQLMNAQYADVVVTAQKVHSMPHQTFAFIHYVAARACEHLNRLPQAISELKVFLNENPSGPRAAAASQELAILQKQVH